MSISYVCLHCKCRARTFHDIFQCQYPIIITCSAYFYKQIFSWNNERSVHHFSTKEEDGKEALSQTLTYRLKRYLYDFWNALDVFFYLVTITAILIRFIKTSDSSGSGGYVVGAKLARRFYSLSLFTMYMKLLHAILMSRKLGPKIIMIKEMVFK